MRFAWFAEKLTRREDPRRPAGTAHGLKGLLSRETAWSASRLSKKSAGIKENELLWSRRTLSWDIPEREGRGPERELDWSSNCWREVRFRISWGRLPSRLFPPIWMWVIRFSEQRTKVHLQGSVSFLHPREVSPLMDFDRDIIAEISPASVCDFTDMIDESRKMKNMMVLFIFMEDKDKAKMRRCLDIVRKKANMRRKEQGKGRGRGRIENSKRADRATKTAFSLLGVCVLERKKATMRRKADFFSGFLDFGKEES